MSSLSENTTTKPTCHIFRIRVAKGRQVLGQRDMMLRPVNGMERVPANSHPPWPRSAKTWPRAHPVPLFELGCAPDNPVLIASARTQPQAGQAGARPNHPRPQNRIHGMAQTRFRLRWHPPGPCSRNPSRRSMARRRGKWTVVPAKLMLGGLCVTGPRGAVSMSTPTKPPSYKCHS